MNKLSPVIQSSSPVQQSSPQSSPVIRYDRTPSQVPLHTFELTFDALSVGTMANKYVV